MGIIIDEETAKVYDLEGDDAGELQAQLVTVIEQLKAVLGEDDIGMNNKGEQECCRCFEPLAGYSLMYCVANNLSPNAAFMCINPDCPRHIARKWLKEMEGEDD